MLVLGGAWPRAQDLDNRRERPVVLDRDTVRLDSVSIAPGSLSLVAGQHAGGHGLLPRAILARAPVPCAPVRPRTRSSPATGRCPLLLAGPFRHKDPHGCSTPSPDRPDPFKYVPGKGSNDPLGIQGLNKSGSISRGILFGNNQDLSVNSALNLELSGRLTDRINVLASVTDNNIPIQAGGNTAELQDFDRVFIKLFDDRQELIAGDFVLQRPKSHFLTYLKKTKGIGYSTLLGWTRWTRSGQGTARRAGVERGHQQGQVLAQCDPRAWKACRGPTA